MNDIAAYLKDRAATSELANRVRLAEIQVREIARDRDHWKRRAEKAEAALASVSRATV